MFRSTHDLSDLVNSSTHKSCSAVHTCEVIKTELKWMIGLQEHHTVYNETEFSFGLDFLGYFH